MFIIRDLICMMLLYTDIDYSIIKIRIIYTQKMRESKSINLSIFRYNEKIHAKLYMYALFRNKNFKKEDWKLSLSSEWMAAMEWTFLSKSIFDK